MNQPDYRQDSTKGLTSDLEGTRYSARNGRGIYNFSPQQCAQLQLFNAQLHRLVAGSLQDAIKTTAETCRDGFVSEIHDKQDILIKSVERLQENIDAISDRLTSHEAQSTSRQQCFAEQLQNVIESIDHQYQSITTIESQIGYISDRLAETPKAVNHATRNELHPTQLPKDSSRNLETEKRADTDETEISDTIQDNLHQQLGVYYEADDNVNGEPPSNNYTLTETNESARDENIAQKPCKKRKISSSDHSGDSDTVATPAQIKMSYQTDCTTSSQDSIMLEQIFLVIHERLGKDLQCVGDYRFSTSDEDGKPYFELNCLMPNGQWYWFAESEVQRCVPSAVGTFWGCGSANWIAPESGGKDGSQEIWKRPRATDDDGVPDQFIITCVRTCKNGQKELLIQKIGYPIVQETWYDEDAVAEKWPGEYGSYRSAYARHHERANDEEPQLIAVVGHRLNGEKGSKKGIQLSCQWADDSETWEYEDKIQRKYNAAVLTYWHSDLDARRVFKVPDQPLRILRHEKTSSTLLLKVQMVGGSLCDGRVICGRFQCVKSSACMPLVLLEPLEKLLPKWPEMTRKYLENQELTQYYANTTIIRRSKRLRCGKVTGVE